MTFLAPANELNRKDKQYNNDNEEGYKKDNKGDQAKK